MYNATMRPNILLFITDQHRADYLGCSSHPVLRTPHIDSIAARGVNPDEIETYANGARKAVYRDPDGNELGFAAGPPRRP